jgi:hypothetical protein
LTFESTSRRQAALDSLWSSERPGSDSYRRQASRLPSAGAILGARDAVGADALEMTADNFRQCLARARRDLHHFMNNQCGLVNKNNPCHCPKKTRGFI